MPWKDILDNLLEGCQIIDHQYRYVYLNDAVVKQSTYSREQLLGKTMMEMYPGIEETEVFGRIRECMEKRVAHRFENEFKFPDGSKGWFELYMEPIEAGIFILSIDITQRKRVQEETSRSKDEFLAIASHELRTPLTVLRGSLSMMQMGVVGKLPAEAEGLVADSYEASKKLIELVNRFLDVSRLNMNRLEFMPERMDLGAKVREVVDFLAPAAVKKNVKVEIVPRENLPNVWADPARVHQVVFNLVENAIKFTSDGKVMVSFKVKEGIVETVVEDEGVGIETKDQGRLFNTFQYGGNLLTRKSGSTGLGLYLSRRLVEKMGGKLYLIRSVPKEGSVFAFTLPVYGKENTDS